MQNKTVIAIVAVAAVLFCFIFLFEKGLMTTGERAHREDRVFVDFNSNQIEEISIWGAGRQKISIQRISQIEDGEEKWEVISPAKYRASDTEIRAMISSLDFAIKERTIENSPEKSKYGLDKPRLQGSYKIKGNTFSFKIGNDDNTGKKVYVQVGEKEQFYAVDKEFMESLDKDLDDVRDRHLVEGTLSNATSILVKNETDTIRLEKNPAGLTWNIKKDQNTILASNGQVEELLHTVGQLQAESFSENNPKKLESYGLSSAPITIAVSLPNKKQVELQFGAPCKNGGFHATVKGSGTVSCVAEEKVKILQRPAGRYLEMHPAVFTEQDVDRITVTRKSATVSLEKTPEGLWTAKGDESAKLDQMAVTDLVEKFTQTVAEGISVGQNPDFENLNPTATVNFQLDAGQAPVEIEIFSKLKDENTKVVISRKGEPAYLQMAPSFLDGITASPLYYREKILTHGHETDVFAVEIAGHLPQTLKKTDGKWQITSPLNIQGDNPLIKQLCDLLAIVKVEQFISKQSLPEHGFSRPWATVTAKLTTHKEAHQANGTHQGTDEAPNEKTVILEIGNQSSDHTRYARLTTGDQVVFTIGSIYLDLLKKPLVARNLLAINSPIINRVEFIRGGHTLIAQRKGDEWVGEDKEIDSITLKRLLIDLGHIKAIRAASFTSEIASPVLVLKLHSDEGNEPAVLEFGEKTSDNAENGYFAQKSNLDLTFVVPGRIVEELKAFGK